MEDTEGSSSETGRDKRFLPAYSLYRFISKRGVDGDASKEALSASSDSSFPEPTKKEQSGQEFSLSVVVTNLSNENEAQLCGFLSRKLHRGAIYSGTGHISAVDICPEEKEKMSAMCYYCLVRQSQTSAAGSDEEGQSYSSSDFLVCFLTAADVLLDLFKPELDKYSSKLGFILESDTAELDLTVRPYLEGWSRDVMEYICRCVDFLGPDLRYLIYAAVMDATITFQCDDNDVYDNQIKSDLQRLVECCSLSDFLASMKSDSPSDICSPMSETGSNTLLTGCMVATHFQEKDDPSFTVTLKSDGSYGLSSKECNVFCEDWMTALVKGEKDNPVFLRQVIENYKLKAIQDMNTLKRIIRLAETDHYSLYRAYQFLNSSDNGSILLHHAKTEQHTLSSPATSYVVSSLSRYIASRTMTR